MTARARVTSSVYMEWAKTRSQARFNLATSGVAEYRLADLPVTLGDLELTGPSFYGYAPLQERLAAKCGVPVECIVAATGTSMANFLALAALVEPGDEVLVEQPTYEPILAAAGFLQARVRRFRRRAASARACSSTKSISMPSSIGRRGQRCIWGPTSSSRAVSPKSTASAACVAGGWWPIPVSRGECGASTISATTWRRIRPSG